MTGETITLTYREACRAALHDALASDDRVFLMGEDIGMYGGCFAVSLGLLEEFGPDRVRDTPLSESVFVGAGIGAALGGMRPIVEIMTVNFSLLALDQILNNAATLRHMSGGQLNVPLVIRMTTGAGRQLAAQHSHSLEGWYAHIPGLRILAPATVEDARGMLAPALADPDPVLLFEHGALYNVAADIPADAGAVDITKAAIRRPGGDVTLIAYGATVATALAAAEDLAASGISASVVDLRTLRPLDDETIMGEVRRSHRVVIVDEGWRSGSLSAEISARIMEQAFFDLDAPVARVCSVEVPMPYAKHLEDAALPSVDAVVAAATRCATVADAHVFRMPSLGADMTEGTMLEWLVAPGDSVSRGDLVAVVKTDKADVEVEVFESGTIAELLAEVGETLPVGAPLATITAPGEPAPSPPPPVSPPVPAPPAVAPSPPPARPAPPAAPPPAPVPQPDRIVATPYARKRAAELGVDLARLAPTQPGHPITATEVEQARTVPPATPVDQASAMRLSIARLMARSKREIPHYYLDDDVDLTHTQHWLADANRERSVEERLLPAAVFCKAVAGAVRHHSALNGFWIDDAFVPGAGVHLGVAIALRGGGLVAPALHDADTLSLPELMHALRDLTVRARGGRLRASEMTDATITVTMLGDQGVRSVFGVIFPPQVAIVGFGKVIDRAWSADGGIGLRPVVNVTLAADHRPTDGHTGARFLADIGRRLQHPEDLA